MASSKFLLVLFPLLLLLASSASAQKRRFQLSDEQQCRLRRISPLQPSDKIQSEGGTSERWDHREEQLQCAGVSAVRNILRPNGLSLPNYQPTPRLVFIERGEGYVSVIFPGCAETFESQTVQRRQEREYQKQGTAGDLHQRVHRIRRGDIIAFPAGAVHWTYNDGNEDLVAVSINDYNHISNQLDERPRSFYLAGGEQSSGGQESEEGSSQNIFKGFDSNLLAEVFNVNEELIRKIQSENKRGLIVTAKERLRFIKPEESWRESESESERGRRRTNGLEETFCSLKFFTSLEHRREADIYSKQAGSLNVVDKEKLPILKYVDLSAERGRLFQNALLSPDWSSFGHTIVYVTRGEAQIQITDQSGENLMNERVSQGNLFVVPQFYTSMARAGGDGFEWVAFKTTGSPIRNPLTGYTSVIRALPLQVVSQSYQISPSEAQDLKNNRGGQSFLLSPGRSQRS